MYHIKLSNLSFQLICLIVLFNYSTSKSIESKLNGLSISSILNKSNKIDDQIDLNLDHNSNKVNLPTKHVLSEEIIVCFFS